MSGACRLLDSTNLLNLQSSQFENNLKSAKENLRKLKENQRSSKESLKAVKDKSMANKENSNCMNNKMRLDCGLLAKRPAPLDYDYFLNRLSMGRRPAELRELSNYQNFTYGSVANS